MASLNSPFRTGYIAMHDVMHKIYSSRIDVFAIGVANLGLRNAASARPLKTDTRRRANGYKMRVHGTA